MSEEQKTAVDEFILREIDTVPHLEALLLLWNSRTQEWTAEKMAKALYLREKETLAILQNLARKGLIAASGNEYCYVTTERDALLEEVERTYKRELIRIARMIHAKGSAAVREFARAFKFTDEEQS